MDHAVFSSNLNTDYSFFMPITTACWRLRGYRPLILLAGSAKQWMSDPQHTLEVKRARELGADIHFLGDFGSPDSVKSSTVAQVSRLCGSAVHGIADTDYLLLGDIDMLVLGAWVGSDRDPAKQIQIYYANAYANEMPPHYPICYVGANAKTWREMLSIPDDLHKAVASMLEIAPKGDADAWNFDEMLLSRRICQWPEYPANVQLITRTFINGQWRLDRSGWDEGWQHLGESINGVADAHLPRPGYTFDNWARIRPVLKLAIPPDMLEWVDTYYTEWLETAEML